MSRIKTLLSRRALLGWAGAAAGAAAFGPLACRRATPTAGPSNAGSKPFAGQTLRIFVYAGAWENTFREAFVASFQELTGATVIIDPGWWDSVPRLKASPPGQPAFDLVLTDATQGYPAIREGLFAQLNWEAIPNHRAIAPSVLDNWTYREGYAVPFPESAMTLAYRRDRIAQAPSSWGALYDAPHQGRLGLYNSFYMSLYTIAGVKAALDGAPGTAAQLCETQLDEVFRLAVEMRDRVRVWWPTSTDMALNLAQGHVDIGNMHSTDMLPAMREHANLGAVIPAQDGAFVQLLWVVPADTPQRDLAHAAIDHIFSSTFQYEMARRGSATPLVDVAARVAAEDPLWAAMYPGDAAALAGVQYYPYDAYFRDWDAIAARWDREVLRT